MKNLLLLLTIAIFMGCNQTEQVSDQKYDVDLDSKDASKPLCLVHLTQPLA